MGESRSHRYLRTAYGFASICAKAGGISSRRFLRQQCGKPFSCSKRPIVYNWNPGPRRGKEGAIEKRIAETWHIIALQEAIEYVDHELFVNRFHVTHFGGRAVLFNKDTFFLRTSRSNPFTSTIPGANCLMKLWKESQAGFCGACHHLPLFADNPSMIKRHSRSCHYTLTTFTLKNVT